MLRDYIISDCEEEVVMWSMPGNNVVGNTHHIASSRVMLDRHNYIITNVMHERIIDLLQNGCDVDLYIHAETAAIANWK